jgi:hypothetical protein
VKTTTQFDIGADLSDMPSGITVSVNSRHKGHMRMVIEGGGTDFTTDQAERVARAILSMAKRGKAMHRKIYGANP